MDALVISERLERAGADLVSLSEKIDTTTAAGKMVFRMLAVLSEFERDQLSERTAAAMAAERRPRRAVPGWAWGAVAASLLTLGVFGTLMNRSGVDPPPPLPREVVATPPLPSDPAALPAGMIEVFDSPGTADVVEMTVGDVDVVMIFDEAMKI